MVQFLWLDYIRGFCGGVTMGLALLMLLVLSGRYLGFSGIVGRGITFYRGDWVWRWVFCAGFLVAALVVQYAELPVSIAPITKPGDWPVLVLGGYLVGFGTHLGNGCTSGHGLCGLSRLSPRSLTATASFFAVGLITGSVTPYTPYAATVALAALTGAFGLLVRAYASFVEPPEPSWPAPRSALAQLLDWRGLVVAFAAALVFGLGLGVSEMTNPNKVLAFLAIGANWDATLAFVMLGALSVGLPGFHHVLGRRERPLLAPAFAPTKRWPLTAPIIVGGVVFGVGWGLVGLCPGPALFNLVQGDLDYYVWFLCQAAGIYIHYAVDLGFSRLGAGWRAARGLAPEAGLEEEQDQQEKPQQEGQLLGQLEAGGGGLKRESTADVGMLSVGQP